MTLNLKFGNNIRGVTLSEVEGECRDLCFDSAQQDKISTFDTTSFGEFFIKLKAPGNKPNFL